MSSISKAYTDKEKEKKGKRPGLGESLKDPEFKRSFKRIIALIFKLFPDHRSYHLHDLCHR